MPSTKKARGTARRAARARKSRASAAKATRKAPPKKAAAKAWTPPTGPGTVCWNEMMTTDPAGSKAFYEGLFGWTPSNVPAGSTEYTVWSRGKDGVAAVQAVKPAWDGNRSYWLPSISVTDVDATVAKAQALSATVVQPPTDVADYGRYAVLRDPQGALVSLWQSKPR